MASLTWQGEKQKSATWEPPNSFWELCPLQREHLGWQQVNLAEPLTSTTLHLLLVEEKPEHLGSRFKHLMPKPQQDSLLRTAKHRVLLEKHPPAPHCLVCTPKDGSWSTLESKGTVGSACRAEMWDMCPVHDVLCITV